MLVTLGENDIKTLDDFAGLAGDELVEMLAASDKGGAKLELDEANELIMAARAHWFDGAEAGAAEPGAAEPGAVEPGAIEPGAIEKE
jgi:transcription termination/antitermination protein NusA